MARFVLKTRTLPFEKEAQAKESDKFRLLGEIYEYRSPEGEGDFFVDELETFLKKNPPASEFGAVHDHSADLQKMQLVCFALPHKSRNSYIRSAYQRYRVYVKVKE